MAEAVESSGQKTTSTAVTVWLSSSKNVNL